MLPRQEHPIQPEGETDAGRGAPAEQFDQTVVSAAPAQRLLLTLGAVAVVLDRGTGVVIQAANERRLEPVRNAHGVEMRPDRREVRRACLTK